MISIALAWLVQSVPGSPAWVERHTFPMPALAACELPGARRVGRLARLPPTIRAGLVRHFGPDQPLADAGGPFNATDVVADTTPTRRFLRGLERHGRWAIWYEQGGRAHSFHVLGVSRHGLATTLDGGFAAQLCRTSRAYLTGAADGGG